MLQLLHINQPEQQNVSDVGYTKIPGKSYQSRVIISTGFQVGEIILL